MEINLEGLNHFVSKRIKPFLEDILDKYRDKIHSIHIVGSAVTPDFNEKTSDINSIIILHNMDIEFVEFLAPHGRKYGKKRISAPLVMTIEYIKNSLDVFPVEFHDFRLIHKTVYGEDILSGLEIKMENLRIQCEREIKARLMGIIRGYISSAGDRELITEILIRSFTGCIPLMRAIIYLKGEEPPILRKDVIKRFQTISDTSHDVFDKLMLLRNRQLRPSMKELNYIFENYYHSLKKTSRFLDELI